MKTENTVSSIDLAISNELVNKILKKLQLNTSIEVSEGGLTALYKAWCHNVPFDNIWKRLNLSNNKFSEQDQLNATDFFEIWLNQGLGGTCWTTTKALYALLTNLGFNARVITGSMGDMGMANHGSIIVTVDNKEFIVDTSMLNEQPIEFKNIKLTNGVHGINVVKNEDKTVVFFEHVMSKNQMPWALVDNNIDTNLLNIQHDNSLIQSLFNDCLYIRKNAVDGVHSIIGNTYYFKTANKITSQEFNSNQLITVLIETFGLSKTITNFMKKTDVLNVPEQAPLLDLINSNKVKGPTPNEIDVESNKVIIWFMKVLSTNEFKTKDKLLAIEANFSNAVIDKNTSGIIESQQNVISLILNTMLLNPSESDAAKRKAAKKMSLAIISDINNSDPNWWAVNELIGVTTTDLIWGFYWSETDQTAFIDFITCINNDPKTQFTELAKKVRLSLEASVKYQADFENCINEYQKKLNPKMSDRLVKTIVETSSFPCLEEDLKMFTQTLIEPSTW